MALGHFDNIINIDNFDFKVKFYIAQQFPYEAALDNDILDQTYMILTSNGATFRRRNESVGEQSDEVDDFKLFCSTVVIDDDVALNLSHLSKENPENIEPSPISMKIILSDDIPIFQRPRRLSYFDHGVVEQPVKDWLSESFIRPSTSEYASLIVLASKKKKNFTFQRTRRLYNVSWK